MKYNFCTLFNSNYLTKGLALHRSMLQHCDNFHLYIFAFDDITYKVLKELNLDSSTIISLDEFEDKKLLDIKTTRTSTEYCWTATSSTILYILEKYKVESCTYVDADIFFYSSPKPIFDELGDDSILLTEHGYSPEYRKKIKIAGKYCVQFITFKNNEYGLTALKWWRDRCLEWCYAYYEDGKFGDQLYLEDWTTRFQGVHVLQHPGGGIAMWNVSKYNFELENEQIIGAEKTSNKRFEVIFYHFHYLRFYNNNLVELGRTNFSEKVFNLFYKPYIKLLVGLKREISLINNSFDPNGTTRNPIKWKSPVIYLLRKLKGTYNIFNINKFLEI
jgi:hypothetical protein